MAANSSARLRPAGSLLRGQGEPEPADRVLLALEVLVELDGQDGARPRGPTASAISKVAQCVTPVAGETAQPCAGSLSLPSIALATSKFVLAEVGQRVLQASFSTCVGSVQRGGVDLELVEHEVAVLRRPGPLLGERLVGQDFQPEAGEPVRSVSATIV